MYANEGWQASLLASTSAQPASSRVPWARITDHVYIYIRTAPWFDLEEEKTREKKEREIKIYYISNEQQKKKRKKIKDNK